MVIKTELNDFRVDDIYTVNGLVDMCNVDEDLYSLSNRNNILRLAAQYFYHIDGLRDITLFIISNEQTPSNPSLHISPFYFSLVAFEG